VTRSRGINRPRWRPTDEQIAIVRARFAVTRTKDIAQQLGATYSQVVKLAHKLKLKKDPAWLAGDQSGRVTGVQGMGTRFAPGHTPWIKGRKGLLQSPETVFKPGHRPHNQANVGAFRIFGGYLQIKTGETGYSPRDWISYHRHVWQLVHGPVPDGFVVVFRDGQRRTAPDQITLDQLECIGRRENMLRNIYHWYGLEVAAIVHLRGALTRTINNRAKESAT
jgi:hypothetical protein